MRFRSRWGKWSPTLRWIGVCTGTFAVLAYSLISVISAGILTQSQNRPVSLRPRSVSEAAQAWSIRTSDGLTLRGCYLPSRSSNRLVVLVHGMGESWDRMANLGRDLHGLGYHVLMFDLRGHGESDPHRLTMGRLERRDLRCVLGWALRRGFRPDQIGWIGRSMGASTILMEAAENSDVRLAVLDSPYGHLPELLDQQLTEHSRLPKAFNPGIILAAHRVFGVRTDDLIPIRHARRWGNRPMLLIHGRQDRVVPVGQSRMLANSVGSSCTLITLPGVEHVEAYRKLGSSYVQLVDRFLDRHLAP